MQKTYTTFTVFFILFWFPLATAYAEVAGESKPNIIFIMADDLGKGLLSVYGAESMIKTPNIERLAKEGTIFKNAYATSLCVPTRAKLMSGRYVLNTGAHANKYMFDGYFDKRHSYYLDGRFHVKKGRASGFYDNARHSSIWDAFSPSSMIYPVLDVQYTPSFALPLKQAGYATAIVGKWHISNYFRQPRIFRTFGFDQWMISTRHKNSSAFTDKGFVATTGFLPEKMADFAVNFIKENKNNPFFLYYPMHLIHKPLLATPLNPDAESEPEKIIAMAEYVDLIIGRLIKTLEELDIRNHTIIFFSGDNGSYSSAVSVVPKRTLIGCCGKSSLSERGVSVPLIVSGGPVMVRGETDALTDFTDILPTIADFAGVSVIRAKQKDDNDYRGIERQYTLVAERYKVDGYSIAPFLTGKTRDTPRTWIMAVGGHSGRHLVFRDKQHKLWIDKGKFYDLYNDPFEKNNLYENSEASIVLAKQRLENMWDKVSESFYYIEDQVDPIDWDYGMLAHWSMDRLALSTNNTILSDTEGGYDGESDNGFGFHRQGKLGEAIIADRIYAPYSQGLFYSSIKGDNGRYFGPLSYIKRSMRYTYLKVAKNQLNKLIGKINEKFRKKFFTSMTLSAWVQTPEPDQHIYLLKQPYINKESSLMSFLVTKDKTIKFELSTDDELRELESGIIDERLWGQWMHIAVTWDGDNGCGKAVIYVNGRSVSEGCLGESLSAEGADDLLLGGFIQSAMPNISKLLVDDIAIWRQPLMPMQVEALYNLGNSFSYNASEVDSLFNTPADSGVTKIGDHVWQRIPIDNTTDTNRLIIRKLPNAIELQFGEVMAVRLDKNKI